MLCPKCLQTISEKSKVCSNCGYSIENAKAAKTIRKLTFGYMIAALIPIILLAGVLVYYVADTYVFTPLARKGMTVEELLCDKLNVWSEKKPEKSGISGLEKTKGTSGDYALVYNFCPLGTQETSDELALTIAEDLISTFGERSELNKMSVLVRLPYRDEYLKTVWKPYMYFELNRETLAKYSYENFVSKDLYIVADNLKTYK